MFLHASFKFITLVICLGQISAVTSLVATASHLILLLLLLLHLVTVSHGRHVTACSTHIAVLLRRSCTADRAGAEWHRISRCLINNIWVIGLLRLWWVYKGRRLLVWSICLRDDHSWICVKHGSWGRSLLLVHELWTSSNGDNSCIYIYRLSMRSSAKELRASLIPNIVLISHWSPIERVLHSSSLIVRLGV